MQATKKKTTPQSVIRIENLHSVNEDSRSPRSLSNTNENSSIEKDIEKPIVTQDTKNLEQLRVEPQVENKPERLNGNDKDNKVYLKANTIESSPCEKVDDPEEEKVLIRNREFIKPKKNEGSYSRIFGNKGRGSTIYIKAETCCVCNRSIVDTMDPIVHMPSCGHGYHIKCGIKWAEINSCPSCDTNKYVPVEVKKVPTVGDIGSLQTLETKFGKQESMKQFDVKQFKCKELTIQQKFNIRGLNVLQLEEIKNTIKEKITPRILNELYNTDSMQQLMIENVNIRQIYYEIGIKTFSELKNHGYKDEMLLDKEFSEPDVMAKLYGLNKYKILQITNYKLRDFIKSGFDLSDLAEYEWTIDEMIKDKLKKEHITSIFNRTNVFYSPSEMKNEFGLKLEHIFDLGLDIAYMKRKWGWSEKEFINTFVPKKEQLLSLGYSGVPSEPKVKPKVKNLNCSTHSHKTKKKR